MKKTILLTIWLSALLGVLAASAQDSGMLTITLNHSAKIDEQDTLIIGVYRAEKQPQVMALLEKLMDLYTTQPNKENLESLEEEIKRLSDDGSEKRAEYIKELREEIAQIEKSSDSYWENLARGSGMSAAELKRKNLERRQRSLDNQLNYNDKPRQRDLALLEEALRQEKAKVGDKEAMYAVKRQIAALMVDGRLCNYDEIRDFRHGRAAVAIRERFFSRGEGVWTTRKRWGFLDENARIVIPCQYTWVFNFNNQKYYRSAGVFERFEDRDKRGWTTVGHTEASGNIGMIDRDGNLKIPFKFVAHERHHSWIEFVETRWGEFAPVTILQRGKYVEGIIDREGNYTLEPAYDHIVYYDDLRCFGTTGENRVFFDPYGKKIETGDP